MSDGEYGSDNRNIFQDQEFNNNNNDDDDPESRNRKRILQDLEFNQRKRRKHDSDNDNDYDGPGGGREGRNEDRDNNAGVAAAEGDEAKAANNNNVDAADANDDDDSDDDNEDNVLNEQVEQISIFGDAGFFKKIKQKWINDGRPECWRCANEQEEGKVSKFFQDMDILIRGARMSDLKKKIEEIYQFHKKRYGIIAGKRNVSYEKWHKYSIYLHITRHNPQDIDATVDLCKGLLRYQVVDIAESFLRYKYKNDKSGQVHINYKGGAELERLTKLAVNLQNKKK